MRRLATTLGLLLLIPATANAGFAVMGVGTTTCGEFTQRYARDPRLYEQVFFSWAQGMMSGMNQVYIAQHDVTRDLQAASVDVQKAALRKYCAAHPNATYMTGVIAMFLSLPKNPAPQAAPHKQ